jgi:hypothetical protein
VNIWCRLLTETRHTVSEEWIRHVVSKVASRTRSPDMRLMALYIREKLGGIGQDSGGLRVPPRAVSMDLPLLEPRDKASSDRLKKCTCKMSTSMQCTCGKITKTRQLRESRPESCAQDGRQRRMCSVQVGVANHPGLAFISSKRHPGSLSIPDKRSKSSPSSMSTETGPKFQDCSRWKMATIRKRIGNVTVDVRTLVDAVEALGGLACVDGQQGSKGKGWRAVAEKMGIDVERNRDAGYQIKKIYWLRQKKMETVSEDDTSGKEGDWLEKGTLPNKRERTANKQHRPSSSLQTRFDPGQTMIT